MTYSQFFYGLLTAGITAPLAAWLTAQFALRRFYAEKVWERKIAAYTEIMEALHEMRQWFDTHWDAETEGRELSEQTQSRLTENYTQAEQKLQRRVDSEKWIISNECINVLESMQRKLHAADDKTDWFGHLDAGTAAIRSAMRELIPVIRRDLRLELPPRKFFRRGS
jgi:hypothetical protein